MAAENLKAQKAPDNQAFGRTAGRYIGQYVNGLSFHQSDEVLLLFKKLGVVSGAYRRSAQHDLLSCMS
ncbi:hypothetical protein LXA00_18010, partial [Erwinia amylovora]|uniref:hypothetical protein n=1 Tax=Erwinia amylovora TaxID=552 RepID=UPI0020BEA83C